MSDRTSNYLGRVIRALSPDRWGELRLLPTLNGQRPTTEELEFALALFEPEEKAAAKQSVTDIRAVLAVNMEDCDRLLTLLS